MDCPPCTSVYRTVCHVHVSRQAASQKRSVSKLHPASFNLTAWSPVNEDDVRSVQSALPAIDASAPQSRGHVTCKLKKVQSEGERIERIESDNVRLLQRMAAIMRTSRLDNRWLAEPPGSFLGRIGIYAPLGSRRSSQQSLEAAAPQHEGAGEIRGRKAACAACRLRAQQQALPPIQYQAIEEAKEEIKSEDNAGKIPKIRKKKMRRGAAGVGTDYRTRELRRAPDWSAASNKVVLTRGQLRVSVTFPAHTGVTLERAGCRPAVLEAEFCSCAAMKA